MLLKNRKRGTVCDDADDDVEICVSKVSTLEALRSEAMARFHKENFPMMSTLEEADWSDSLVSDGFLMGPVTGFRIWLAVLFSWLALSVVRRNTFLEDERMKVLPNDTWTRVLFCASSASTLIVLVGLIGLFSVPYDQRRSLVKVKPSEKYLVVFRIVSRGLNHDALSKTVESCFREMKKTSMFPFIVEVLTDEIESESEANFFVLPRENELLRTTVPSHYQTHHGSLYKARALHYAVEESPVPNDAWLVHLDEETQLTRSGILGIAKMIQEEEEKHVASSGTYQHKIGQGALLYYRSYREYPLLTLADTCRTGDDLGRFFFQYRYFPSCALFGVHGSYIVCRNDLEKRIGFDFGVQGSITEDAFWALKGTEEGYEFRLVEGYLSEQSTQGLGDFLKQRRRWLIGLSLVVACAPTKLRYRIPLFLSLLNWVWTALSHLAFRILDVHPLLRLTAQIQGTFFFSIYIIGMKASLDNAQVKNVFVRMVCFVVQGLAVPLVASFETGAIFYAMLKPSIGFHVVKK